MNENAKEKRAMLLITIIISSVLGAMLAGAMINMEKNGKKP